MSQLLNERICSSDGQLLNESLRANSFQAELNSFWNGFVLIGENSFLLRKEATMKKKQTCYHTHLSWLCSPGSIFFSLRVDLILKFLKERILFLKS